MNATVESSLKQWFRAYVGGFAGEAGQLPFMMKLKDDHSGRVAQDARTLAQDLQWSEGDVRAADILGLYHDVGRFSQFAQFQTFRDDQSVNHGEEGFRVLSDYNVLMACQASDRRHIESGVRYHNARLVRDDLCPDTTRYLRLIRDADKLDILFIMYDAWKTGELFTVPDIALHVDPHGPIHPSVMQALRDRSTVPYPWIKSVADFFVVHLSWMYDFSYRPALRLVRDRRHLDQIAEVLPNTSEVRREIDAARQFIDEQLVESEFGRENRMIGGDHHEEDEGHEAGKKNAI